jgi:hypothetical protein
MPFSTARVTSPKYLRIEDLEVGENRFKEFTNDWRLNNSHFRRQSAWTSAVAKN